MAVFNTAQILNKLASNKPLANSSIISSKHLSSISANTNNFESNTDSSDESSSSANSERTNLSLKPKEGFLNNDKLNELRLALTHILNKQQVLLNRLKLAASGVEISESIPSLLQLARLLDSRLARMVDKIAAFNKSTGLHAESDKQIKSGLELGSRLSAEINVKFLALFGRKVAPAPKEEPIPEKSTTPTLRMR